MLIEIINYDPCPTEKVLELTRIIHQCIDVEKLKKSDIKRLIRKLIRERDMILQSVHVMFKFQCPIFVFNEMKELLKYIKFTDFNFNTKDFSFETSDSFNDTQLNQVTSLFKKVKSVVKNISADNLISNEELYYCLPMGTIVEYTAYVDFLQIYDMALLINTSGIHSKTGEAVMEVFDLVTNKFPEFFSKQNLEIYGASARR